MDAGKCLKTRDKRYSRSSEQSCLGNKTTGKEQKKNRNK